MQEVHRLKPSTVSRGMTVVTGFYRTCVIDAVLEHSPRRLRPPAAGAQRVAGTRAIPPAVRSSPGRGHESTNRFDFASCDARLLGRASQKPAAPTSRISARNMVTASCSSTTKAASRAGRRYTDPRRGAARRGGGSQHRSGTASSVRRHPAASVAVAAAGPRPPFGAGVDPEPLPPPGLPDQAAPPEAVRAVEVAAAGGHHLLLVGHPGSGRSLHARLLHHLRPPLTNDEALEVTAIHSAAGLLLPDAPLITTAPLITPQPTAAGR
jgi:hypothetical protein